MVLTPLKSTILFAVVDLDRAIPEWPEVTYDELNAMFEFLVTQYPEIPSDLSLRDPRGNIHERIRPCPPIAYGRA